MIFGLEKRHLPVLVGNVGMFVVFGSIHALLLMAHLIQPFVGQENFLSKRVGFVVVMAGLGVGGLNEIGEFIITLLVENNGVGGYVNTSLDLVADLVGAIIAWGYVKWRGRALQ